jgi:hypothetical protein
VEVQIKPVADGLQSQLAKNNERVRINTVIQGELAHFLIDLKRRGRISSISLIDLFGLLRTKLTVLNIVMTEQRTVNIRKFKQWVFGNLSEDSPLYLVMQKEEDDMTLEEAIAKSGIIVALIDSSVNFQTIKRGKTIERERKALPTIRTPAI